MIACTIHLRLLWGHQCDLVSEPLRRVPRKVVDALPSLFLYSCFHVLDTLDLELPIKLFPVASTVLGISASMW